MRIALVHDWFTAIAGGEKVVKSILEVFPQAMVYTLFSTLDAPATKEVMGNKTPRATWLRHLPFLKHYYRNLLPVFPSAIESLDLSGFDVIISSSSSVAKGVKKHPGQLHICYCHTPMRYAWDLREEYLNGANLQKGLRSWLTKRQLDKVRKWDQRTSANVDFFIANASHIAERIRNAYARDATVIHPPVQTNFFVPGEARGGYYLATGRHVEHKKLHLVVEAFRSLPDLKLVVSGNGPETSRLKKAAGPNVTFTGWLGKNELLKITQAAKAWVGAAFEDFGISCVEAQSCGVPAIVFDQGGFRETVKESETGMFFSEQSAECLARTIRKFEQSHSWADPQSIRANALQYDEAIFKQKIEAFVINCLDNGIANEVH